MRRFLVPLIGAALCVFILIAFLWWEIKRSGDTLLNLPTPTDGGVIPVTEVIDPEDRALMAMRRGDIKGLQGEWEEAEVQYRLAVEAGGGLPSLRKLAQAQMQLGNKDALGDTVQKMRASGATGEDISLLEVIIALRSGDLAGAESDLASMPLEAPQRRYGAALLHILQGNHDQAQEELAAVMEGNEPLLRTYARVLQSAYDEYGLFPDSPNIHLVTLLGRSLAQIQECALALPLLEQVTTTQGDYRDAWIVRGFCELTTRHTQDALASFERAYALDPEKPETQYYLGRAYASVGDHRNAITFLSYSLKNGFSGEQEVRESLAREAAAVDDLALALEQYDAMTEHPDADVVVFEQYVTTAVKIGLFDDAVTKARAAVARWDSDARAYDILGLALGAAGQRDQAVAALQNALTLDPTLESARQRLEALQ